MKKHRKFGALSSSQDSDQLANKVKGTVLAFSSVIIFLVAKVFGITLTPSDMTEIATALGGIAGAVWAVYGIILHLIALFAEKKEL